MPYHFGIIEQLRDDVSHNQLHFDGCLCSRMSYDFGKDGTFCHEPLGTRQVSTEQEFHVVYKFIILNNEPWSIDVYVDWIVKDRINANIPPDEPDDGQHELISIQTPLI